MKTYYEEFMYKKMSENLLAHFLFNEIIVSFSLMMYEKFTRLILEFKCNGLG